MLRGKRTFCSLLAVLPVLMCCGCNAAAHQKLDLSETKNESESVIQLAEADIVIEQESESKGQAESETKEEKGPDEAANEDEASSGSFTMVFAGDILLSEHVLGAYQRGGGIGGVLDAAYLKEVRDADLFFANEEFPFSERGTKAADKQYTFRLPPEKVSLLQELGLDGVTIANNHALDYGTEALLDTCAVLDQAEIPHTGAGADLNEAAKAAEYEIHGVKVAVIGATRVIPVSNWAAASGHPGMLAAYDPAVLLQRIRELKTDHDLVIAYIHWGIEREERPNEIQKKLGRQMIDAGADLVIGAHPHVLQGIEYYKGCPIVYSLGNFIFGSSIPRTALLKAEIDCGQEAGQQIRLKLIPGTSGAGYTHTLDREEKRQEFFQYMTGISFDVNYEADGTVVSKHDLPDKDRVPENDGIGS